MTSKTPADLEIHPRNIEFGRQEARPRWWLDNDPVATTVYNALSVTFPQGERFFIDAVRRYRDKAPKELQAQIDAFTKQEAVHSREHLAFNQQVTGAGYDITRAEARLRWRLNISRKTPPAVQLAATAALEHFTAMLAHAVLSNPGHFDGASDEARKMWQWHAMEEIEHKAVAFDTYLACVKGGRVGRYLLRVWVMFVATFLFGYTDIRNLIDFFGQDGINKWSTWRKLGRYLYVKPGLLKHVAGPYFAYYRPGFHPWQIDDRELLAPVQADLAAA